VYLKYITHGIFEPKGMILTSMETVDAPDFAKGENGAASDRITTRAGFSRYQRLKAVNKQFLDHEESD